MTLRPCCPKFVVTHLHLGLDRVVHTAVPNTGPPPKPHKYKVRFNLMGDYDGSTVVRRKTPKSNITASAASTWASTLT